MSEKNHHKRVFVAMSGGVDSTTAAVLLKEQGYCVEGLTMSMTAFMEESCGECDPVADAGRLCDFLKIPHHVVDIGETAQKHVLDYFVKEYLRGRTPNPCIQCNIFVKFGALFDRAAALSADYFATGHYVRLVEEPTGEYSLYKARDRKKDQSYFLYGLPREKLPRIFFPLGDMTKNQVRAFALDRGLPCAQRPESQDICFVSDQGYKPFLISRAGEEAFVPGSFKNPAGDVVGEHKGIGFYTIGQRDKLGIALGFPAYVYRIDPGENTIYVGPKEYVFSSGLTAGDFRSQGMNLANGSVDVSARIRYNAPDIGASVSPLDHNCLRVDFAEPQSAVTPGQSVVFYDGDKLLGGAVIEQSIKV